MIITRLAGPVVLVLLHCLTVGTVQVAAQQTFDLIIRGGRLVDGTGAPAKDGDVAITGGKIAAVGSLRDATAGTTIDARGLVVAPGFIDVHTHADEIADHPLAEHFVRMGVTTVVAGNCGGSAEDVGKAFATIEKTGISINYATLFGHNTVRRAVMGTERQDALWVADDNRRSLGKLLRETGKNIVGIETNRCGVGPQISASVNLFSWPALEIVRFEVAPEDRLDFRLGRHLVKREVACFAGVADV